jgi:hypothetical protein
VYVQFAATALPICLRNTQPSALCLPPSAVNPSAAITGNANARLFASGWLLDKDVSKQMRDSMYRELLLFLAVKFCGTRVANFHAGVKEYPSRLLLARALVKRQRKNDVVKKV